MFPLPDSKEEWKGIGLLHSVLKYGNVHTLMEVLEYMKLADDPKWIDTIWREPDFDGRPSFVSLIRSNVFDELIASSYSFTASQSQQVIPISIAKHLFERNNRFGFSALNSILNNKSNVDILKRLKYFKKRSFTNLFQ